MTDDMTYTHNTERNRYEAKRGTSVIGVAEYEVTPKLIVFTHTLVQPEHEGQGIGSALVQFALDDVRQDGRRQVLPLCSFVRHWIDEHPDYASLLEGGDDAAGE